MVNLNCNSLKNIEAIKQGEEPWSSGQGGRLRTHNQEDVGSNPAVYWMDVSIASYYIERKTIKVAKWGTPKKIFKKKQKQLN